MRKKNKTRKRKISFFKILALLLLIASIFILYILYKVNILPNKYYYTIVIALGFINILFSSFLMRRKAKKGIRIFISFLSILVIGVMCFASYYILHTLGFLSKIKNVNYKLENYSVIVLKDSKYEKIEDIDSLDVGYYGNSTGAADANKKILKKVDVTFKKYNDSTSLSEDLINDKTKVIVIEDSVLSMIKEENNEFESKTKVIYKFSIKIKSKAKAKDVDDPLSSYVDTLDIGKLNSYFIDYINFGGYPEIVFSERMRQDPGQYIRHDIVDKVLLRDLPSLYGIQDTQELNRLFIYIAYHSGEEFSYEVISRESEIKKEVLKKYLMYLEAAFLINIVYKVDANAKTMQRITSFKIYLTNPSLRCALFSPLTETDPAIGGMVEFHGE